MSGARNSVAVLLAALFSAACSVDATAPPDDAAATDSAIATVYHDITQRAYWSTFDTQSVNPAAAGFYGGVFDGRYLYLVPYANANGTFDGVVTRYDTQASFTDKASWSTFDATTANAGAQGFDGATFDGRYLYFMPHGWGAAGSACSGLVTRYDTQASFTAKSSWSVFDTATAVPDGGVAGCFTSATFDGRYVYLVPFSNVSFFLSGVALRYDSQSPFASAASWSTFDTTQVNALGAQGFAGAVFDGRYVYYVPNGGQAKWGLTARYDTRASFTDARAWAAFDTASVNPAARSFVGGAFDGRYVYFAPNGYDAPDGVVVRYDTTSSLPFAAAGAWSALDLVQKVDSRSKGFQAAVFDGRYVYFAPNGFVPVDGVVTRYDTQAGFAAPASWSTFDATRLNAAAKGFVGAAFDGRYVYFVPYGDVSRATRSGVVVRFDAKTPASLPNLPAFHGSFY